MSAHCSLPSSFCNIYRQTYQFIEFFYLEMLDSGLFQSAEIVFRCIDILQHRRRFQSDLLHVVRVRLCDLVQAHAERQREDLGAVARSKEDRMPALAVEGW